MVADRTEQVAIRLTKREVKILEAAAKADGATLSEYLRVAGLSTAVLDGNLEAIKLLGENVRTKLSRLMRMDRPGDKLKEAMLST